MITVTYDEFYNKIKTLLEHGHQVFSTHIGGSDQQSPIGLYGDEICLNGNYYEKNDINKITINNTHIVTFEIHSKSGYPKFYYDDYYIYSTFDFK